MPECVAAFIGGGHEEPVAGGNVKKPALVKRNNSLRVVASGLGAVRDSVSTGRDHLWGMLKK
jgi:hypothetical protein